MFTLLVDLPLILPLAACVRFIFATCEVAHLPASPPMFSMFFHAATPRQPKRRCVRRECKAVQEKSEGRFMQYCLDFFRLLVFAIDVCRQSFLPPY